MLLVNTIQYIARTFQGAHTNTYIKSCRLTISCSSLRKPLSVLLETTSVPGGTPDNCYSEER